MEFEECDAGPVGRVTEKMELAPGGGGLPGRVPSRQSADPDPLDSVLPLPGCGIHQTEGAASECSSKSSSSQ